MTRFIPTTIDEMRFVIAAPRGRGAGRAGECDNQASAPANIELASVRFRRCLAIGAPRTDRPHARRNLSFGKLACRLIGGAGSGTVGIEEATMRTTITCTFSAGSLE